MPALSSSLVPVVVGALLHAGLWLGIGWLYSDAIASMVPGEAVEISMPWLQLAHAVLPGLAAGYLCKKSPFIVGFVAVAVAHLSMFPFSWHPVAMPGDPPLFVQAIAGAVRNGISGAVAAAAGFLLAYRSGANSSFKPTSLRDAA